MATLDIPVIWSHYLSVPDFLNNIPLLRSLEPPFCTSCGYSWLTSHLKPLSLRTRLAEPFTTNKADMLHFVWILWTYQSPKATTYLYVYLLKNLPQLQQIKPLFCNFLGILQHTSRLKPLSLSTRLLKQYTTFKEHRASILHFLWLLWTISQDPTCWTIYHK